jgi:hypothetical protein
LHAVLVLGEAVRSRRALQLEQERSERLLLNVLPASIAARLKAGEEVIADAFPEVTVLFADLVDFTRCSQRSSPAQVVACATFGSSSLVLGLCSPPDAMLPAGAGSPRRLVVVSRGSPRGRTVIPRR